MGGHSLPVVVLSYVCTCGLVYTMAEYIAGYVEAHVFHMLGVALWCVSCLRD